MDQQQLCVVCHGAVSSASDVSVCQTLAGPDGGGTHVAFRIYKLLQLEVFSGLVCWQCYTEVELATEYEREMNLAITRLKERRRSDVLRPIGESRRRKRKSNEAGPVAPKVGKNHPDSKVEPAQNDVVEDEAEGFVEGEDVLYVGRQWETFPQFEAELLTYCEQTYTSLMKKRTQGFEGGESSERPYKKVCYVCAPGEVSGGQACPWMLDVHLQLKGMKYTVLRSYLRHKHHVPSHESFWSPSELTEEDQQFYLDHLHVERRVSMAEVARRLWNDRGKRLSVKQLKNWLSWRQRHVKDPLQGGADETVKCEGFDVLEQDEGSAWQQQPDAVPITYEMDS